MVSLTAIERRKHLRRPILETFSFFAVIPSKGTHQVKVHDVSEGGVGFDFDLEGENPAYSPLQSGDVLEIQLFLNQTLAIPLTCKVAVIRLEKNLRRVGAELIHQESQGHQALKAFLHLIDEFQRLGISANAQ